MERENNVAIHKLTTTFAQLAECPPSAGNCWSWTLPLQCLDQTWLSDLGTVFCYKINWKYIWDGNIKVFFILALKKYTRPLMQSLWTQWQRLQHEWLSRCLFSITVAFTYWAFPGARHQSKHFPYTAAWQPDKETEAKSRKGTYPSPTAMQCRSKIQSQLCWPSTLHPSLWHAACSKLLLKQIWVCMCVNICVCVCLYVGVCVKRFIRWW